MSIENPDTYVPIAKTPENCPRIKELKSYFLDQFQISEEFIVQVPGR